MTSGQLASELEVSKRQIMRDIEKLRDAGFPIESCREGYFVPKDALPAKLSLTGEEKFTLAAGLQMIIDTKDPSLGRVASRLLEKISGNNGNADNFPHLLKPRVRDLEEVKKIERLRLAVDMRKRITFSYNKPDGKDGDKVRTVEPCALFFKRHAYYLVAKPLEGDDGFRMFRVSRMKRLKLTREAFTRAAFDLHGYLEDAFELIVSGPVEDVELRFSARVAPFVKELVWHPRQAMKTSPDGSLTYSVRVSVNHEIVRWILGWGADCKVAKPLVLSDMVTDEIAKMSKNYNG